MTVVVPAGSRGGSAEGLTLVVVAAGGAAGALLRFGLDAGFDLSSGFAWVTWAVNVVGCFLLAALPVVGAVRRSPGLTLFLGPGFLGGFTTVSSWAEQSRSLVADGRVEMAGLYVAATVATCVVAAAAGRLLARPVLRTAG